jgi:hydroxymethylbilane synthase
VSVPLSSVGGKGLFTKEIEDALLAREVDLAVHSLKDLPTDIPAGLQITAIPQREDPRDAMVGRRLAELREGAKVGTSSLRRSAQLRRVRPDCQVESVRGNVDTRLRKLDEGQYDSIVLAAAGLTRLGWSSRIAELLGPEVMCPAVGQGALAVETRVGENACQPLDHADTRAAVTAERAVLSALGGGCLTPIGAHARVEGEQIRLMAIVLSADGAESVRNHAEGLARDAQCIGRELGEMLLKQGAARLLDHDGPPR